MSAIRQYSKVPVWIVENHNEVLEPIYRAIASRHLPFEGIAMLHFDSHPDLQIDTHMPADTVFDKQQLLDVLSIENWIMPAIYAGHVGHVTWVKPPWADQLPEGSRKVKVGRDRSSGKLRTNWPDSYFLSDLLFAREEEMENSRDAIIDVVTMETHCLKTRDFSISTSVCSDTRSKPTSTAKSDSDGLRELAGDTSDTGIETQGRTPFESERGASNAALNLNSVASNEDVANTSDTDIETHGRTSFESVRGALHHQNNVESNGNTKSSYEKACSHVSISRNQEKIDPSPATEQSHSSSSRSKSRTSEDSEQDLKDVKRTSPTGKPADNVANLRNSALQQVVGESGDASSQCNSGAAPQHTCYVPKCNSHNECKSVANLHSQDGHQQEQGSETPLPATNDSVVQVFSDFNGRFILDIDLDFFSTRNPFKQMYTKEQYRLMDELYSFAAPVDESGQALEDCQIRRAQQISELSAGVKAVFNGDEYDVSLGDRERFLQVEELVRSLQSTPNIEAECLDPEMVHMAGLTCDDHGELPHHVSTDQEIDSLISTMKELLGKMQTPTMVTISRSSHDDYCPADQVDGIQHKVLKMLQSLYNKLDIHLEYDSHSMTDCT